MNNIDKLKSIIPDQFWDNIYKNKICIRTHPIDKLVKELESTHTFYQEKKRAEKLLEIILETKKKHPKYFERTWYSRVLQTKDNYSQAVGTLGEYRCRYMLEESRFKVEEIAEKSDKTPDFKVKDCTGQELFIEVMTPRMNRAAEEKLRGFYNQEISQFVSKSDIIKVSTVSVNYISENGKDRIIELYKRLLSNKGKAEQTVYGAINILWLNFEDSDLYINKSQFYPCYSDSFKDIYQTSTFGIWQMLYGKKGSSIFGDRTWLKFYEGQLYEKELQQYDGYFRNNHNWTGIIVALSNCQVFFQNPWSKIEVPVKSKQLIMRLNNFDLNASWVDETNELLLERVESKVNELERIHQIFNK